MADRGVYWKVAVVFKEGVKEFVFKDKVMSLGEGQNAVKISVVSDNPYATLSWEHDMINGVLDNFVGTDWSGMGAIIY